VAFGSRGGYVPFIGGPAQTHRDGAVGVTGTHLVHPGTTSGGQRCGPARAGL